MSRNADLFAAARNLMPGGVNSPVRAFKSVGGDPFFAVRAEGPYLFDADGKRYIDYVGSWGPMILGHAHPRVLDAVKAEIVAMLDELKAKRPGFDYGLREIMSFLPTATPKDSPVVDATARAIARVLGREPGYISSPGTYDQKHIVRTGKLNQCIAYGPGILDLAHQPRSQMNDCQF